MNTAVTLVNYPELPAALTIEEHDLLQQCEQIIHDGIDIFYDVANALATVNKRKLYRDTYNTFEAYCREKWDMGRAQAYRLIDADEVKENLSPLGDTTPLPEKESHIRALKQAPAEKQAEVWKDVVDSGDPVTAPRIKQAVQEVLPKPTHSTLGGMTAEEVNAWREKPQVIHTYNTEGTITKTLIISKDHRTHAKPDDLKCPSQTDTGCEESYIQSVYLENTQCNGNCHTCQNPCKNRKPIDDRHNQSLGRCLSCNKQVKVYGLWESMSVKDGQPVSIGICRECAILATHELVKGFNSANKEYDERQKDTAGTYEWRFAHCTMDRWLIWYRWQKYREDFGKIQVDSMKLKGTVRELERKYAEQSSKYEELSNLYLNLKKQAELKA